MKLVRIFLCLCVTTTLFSQETPKVFPLWEDGAPGFEHLKDQPEKAKDWWVKNIHNPSLTAYFPEKEKANGTAVIICPGGGHKELVFDAEGRDAALYLNTLGITAFVLKYRLAREEGSPYELGIHSREDALRAVRTVRNNAKKWGLDVNKIGMLGFSAGGEVVASVAYENPIVNQDTSDEIDRENGKPDFQMLIYPGPLGIPETIPQDAPPLFMVVANDDLCCSNSVVRLLTGYRKAILPVEAHIYAKGGHGFNMGYRTELKSVSSWPQRMNDWLADNSYLTK